MSKYISRVSDAGESACRRSSVCAGLPSGLVGAIIHASVKYTCRQLVIAAAAVLKKLQRR